MVEYIDISVAVSPDIPVWEGDPKVSIKSLASIAKGDIANVSYLEMGAHVGTHVDAPVHFVAGRKGVDNLVLSALMGEAVVLDFSKVSHEITARDFESANVPAGTERILCKTSNSSLWSQHPAEFYKDFVGISEDGARWLVDHHIKLIGVDYLGVERFDQVAQGAPTHHLLLAAEVIIIEGLNLTGVTAGSYGLICLPIKFKDLDGAPCRAILVKDQ